MNHSLRMEDVFVITLDRERLSFGARSLHCNRRETPDGTGNRPGYFSEKNHDDAHEHADGQQNSKEKDRQVIKGRTTWGSQKDNENGRQIRGSWKSGKEARANSDAQVDADADGC
jgi:hypothetical protein